MSDDGRPHLGKYDKFGEFSRSINPRWKIYVDTCSLYTAMDEGSLFWNRFVPVLQDNDSRFIITAGTFQEIKKHKHKSGSKISKTAAELEQVLYRFSKSQMNLMVTVGDEGEFHDQAIQAKIRARALSFNQVYITNDLANAWDVYNSVINSQSVNRGVKKLLIYRIGKSGELVGHNQLKYLSELNQKEIGEFFELWHAQKFQEASEYLAQLTDYRPPWLKKKPHKINSASQLEERHPFERETTEVNFEEPVVRSLVNPDYDMPTAGSKLRAIQGDAVIEVVLKERIARGGEGVIFTVASGSDNDARFLAKIYKKSKLYRSVEAANETMLKINYIVGRGFYKLPMRKMPDYLGEWVKFPLYVLINEDDEFVGYLMSRAAGIPLARLIADGAVESEFKRLYPNVTKIDLVDICINFLKIVDDLHRHNIIIGDLNANNIFVDPNTKEVFLIDADSYQYGDKFSCNVRVEKYTSPEFLREHETKFRSKQNELFVVARILCEVLMMVDNPYNSTIAQDPIDDMVNGRFRYTFEFLNQDGVRQSNKEAPAEELEIRWGQLTRSIKNAFGNTFHRDGKFWKPGHRWTATKWMHYLGEYKAEIEESLANGDGIVSNEVFPSQRRKWVTHFTCKVCGGSGEQEPNEFSSIIYPRINPKDLKSIASNYHFDCYCSENDLVDIECEKCGADMGVGKRNRTDGKNYICQDCWEETSCISCGKPFARWMLDENGRCRKCANQVRVNCIDCGRPIPKWIHDRNSGKCDDCLKGVVAYCAHCGSFIGKRQPRKDGKEQYCDECWKPAKCKDCGWDNHGRMKKWMFDKDGRCRKCASRTPSKDTAASQASTKPVQQEAEKQTSKKSFFERLFGW